MQKKHEICEGEKVNDNIGGDDVDSVEEATMRSNKRSLYGYDDLVSGFDAPTCSYDNFYDIFENEDETITEDSIVWVNTNECFGKEGSLKLFTVI